MNRVDHSSHTSGFQLVCRQKIVYLHYACSKHKISMILLGIMT